MRKKTNHGSNGRNNRSRGKGRGGGGDSQSLARQKKNALQQKEKYLNMARDAQTNGDRVDAEYYFQHVEHFSRVVAEIIEKEPAPKESKDKADAQDDSPKDGNKKADNDNEGNAEANADAADQDIPLPAGVLPEAEVAATGN